MHHIFGWMTLGLAASLLAQAIWPRHASKLKWIVPTFLLAGGIFLFFMADRDLYRLTDLRQFRDREVQLHKTLAIIMGTLGATGLWRVLRRKGAAADAAATKKESNSKLVAVLALIGGSLLFTHVHTVAPYANVAAGVYIAHVVLGLTALSIGMTRLMQDWVPGWKRGLAMAFGGLMAMESLLLITYNEGLPWYIGYGTYNRWGPHGGTVAPYGAYRAELMVDQATGTADVYVLDRFKDEPLRLHTFGHESLLIERGYTDTAVDLMAVSPQLAEVVGSNASIGPQQYETDHFQGKAELLKHVAAFSARMGLGGRMGYFDPWVTPVVAAVPPNELALYECPMHEGMRSVKEGTCPLCGMEMMPIRAPRPAGELHDTGYELRVSGGGRGSAGAFVLRPVKDGRTLTTLAIVHTQPMHLIVVSEDLAYFDHVHPLPAGGGNGKEGDGTFVWQYRFPHEGRYILFADYTPRGDRAQVFRQVIRVENGEITLGGDVNLARDLIVDPARSKMVAEVPAGKTPQDSAALDLNQANSQVGDVMAELVTQPRVLKAGMHAELLFRLSDASGHPVSDLKPYLGAMGHCVVISEDTGVYLHSHPVQLLTPAADDRGGPEVAFHTLFPKAGRYRIWAQFKRPSANGGDQLVIASFTVQVAESWVPPSVMNALLGE
jgi:hypothetical protein